MLALNNVSVTFNRGLASEVKALRGVNFTISPGDFVTVIGANGAGKSTLFNVIAGTLTPDWGTITLRGKNITQQPEYVRSRNVGRVFQNPATGTCAGLSVLENLSLAALRGKRHGLRNGVKRSQRAEFHDLVKSVQMGLEDRLDSEVSLLSGGQRQAITLLMATLNQPELLLLDEHTAALDPNAAAQIMELTVQLAEQHHLTVLMITHSMQQACQIGNRVIMMNQGQLLFEVTGTDRQSLTVETLISRFRALRSEDALTDRLLLD